jgi:hypothetical protein
LEVTRVFKVASQIMLQESSMGFKSLCLEPEEGLQVNSFVPEIKDASPKIPKLRKQGSLVSKLKYKFFFI